MTKYYRVFKKVRGTWEESDLGRNSQNSKKIAQKAVERLEFLGYEAKFTEYNNQPDWADGV